MRSEAIPLEIFGGPEVIMETVGIRSAPKTELAKGSLPEGAVKAQNVVAEIAAINSTFKKGDLVWYSQRDGSYKDAKIVSVDITVQPPSYAVDLGESVRETEAHRLQQRQPGTAPPSVPGQQALATDPQGSAAAPQQAKQKAEEDELEDLANASVEIQPWGSSDASQSHSAMQPGATLNGSLPHANGFMQHASSFGQHQLHSNGFRHHSSTAGGLHWPAAQLHHETSPNGLRTYALSSSQLASPLSNGSAGTAALDKSAMQGGNHLSNGRNGASPLFHQTVPAAATEQEEDDFGDFADADEPVPEPPYASAPSQRLAGITQNGQLWPQQKWDVRSHHARGPSLDSTASLSSINGPQPADFALLGALDGPPSLGHPNSAKGEREYRVTPASTLSIAHQELGGDSDDDFGDFEDAQPDLAAEIRDKPAVLDRNAPIPLSLLGGEEDDSAPSEPILELAAPWGGLLLPGQPWTSASPKQAAAIAPRSAGTPAAEQPDVAPAPALHQATASSVPGVAVSTSALPAQQLVLGSLAHCMGPGPAAGSTAESSDSWDTAFTEAPHTLPSGNGLPGGSPVQENAADVAPASTADAPPGAGLLPIVQAQSCETQQQAEPQRESGNDLQASPMPEPEGGADTTESCQASSVPVGSADMAVSHGSSAPAGAAVSLSPTAVAAQGQNRMSLGIDWSSMDFDFGHSKSLDNAAAEPSPQDADPGLGEDSAVNGKPAQKKAVNSDSSSGETLDSSVVKEQAAEPQSAPEPADEDDDWDYGDFAEASESLQQHSGLEPAALSSVPVLDLQDFQAAASAFYVEPALAEAASQPDASELNETSLPPGAPPTLRFQNGLPAGAKDVTDAAAITDSAFEADEWGSWDASEAAADSSSPLSAELAGATGLATRISTPRLSARLPPPGSQGSGVLSFDQWGRAYSKLEQQAAKSGPAKQAAASGLKAADCAAAAAAASGLELPEPSWRASETATSDVWASLAALDKAHALGPHAESRAESAGMQLPGHDAYAISSTQSHDASTDPFAASDPLPESGPAQPVISSASDRPEADLLSLPMPAVESTPESWTAIDSFVSGQPSSQTEAAAAPVEHSSAARIGQSSESALQAGKASKVETEAVGSFAEERSWGDGWADSVADSMALPPNQATWPLDSANSWKCKQEEDAAFEKALGCERQTALLCLAQAAAGILASGQHLWAEACSLGITEEALGCSEMQHYLAALAHVRFVARTVDAALCCGATSAPSVEAELCRALAQCEDAWTQASADAMSLADGLAELIRGDSSPAEAARRAHNACQGLSQLQSTGKLDPSAAKCSLTGLPQPLCSEMPIVELHGRPFWAPVANLYLHHCQVSVGRQLR